MDLGSLPVTLPDIRAAHDRIRSAIYQSPCPYSLSLSRLCGCEIFCKLDHLQMTGSFKERGARNKLVLLGESARKTGVIAASAGNHALGLAYHGGLLGIPVTVVMPRGAPIVKIANCRGFGANVVLHGDSYDDSRRHALEISQQRGVPYVPGFDDADIIAGQGTLGLEILEDVPDVDTVIVPVGGGGLIAGVGLAIKSIKPSVRIIGVEPKNAPTLQESIRQKAATKIKTQPTLADGLAVAEVGKHCFQIARQVVDDLLLVDEGQIAAAVLKLLELEKMVVEGAGAVPLAAAIDPKFDLAGKKVVLILSGGNIDVTTVGRIIDRGLATEGRLCRIGADITDRPGSLVALLSVLADVGASVVEVTHDRNFAPADVARVSVSVIVETRDRAHIDEIRRSLAGAGIEAVVG
jgi:threonine dehydratase